MGWGISCSTVAAETQKIKAENRHRAGPETRSHPHRGGWRRVPRACRGQRTFHAAPDAPEQLPTARASHCEVGRRNSHRHVQEAAFGGNFEKKKEVTIFITSGKAKMSQTENKVLIVQKLTTEYTEINNLCASKDAIKSERRIREREDTFKMLPTKGLAPRMTTSQYEQADGEVCPSTKLAPCKKSMFKWP